MIRIFFLLLVFSSTIVASERQYSELSNSDSSGVYRAHGTDTPFVYMEKFNEDFTKVGKHLGNSRSSYEDARKHLDKFGEKLKQLERPAGKRKLPV